MHSRQQEYIPNTSSYNALMTLSLLASLATPLYTLTSKMPLVSLTELISHVHHVRLSGTQLAIGKVFIHRTAFSRPTSISSSCMFLVDGRAQWPTPPCIMMHGQQTLPFWTASITLQMQGILSARSFWSHTVVHDITYRNGIMHKWGRFQVSCITQISLH